MCTNHHRFRCNYKKYVCMKQIMLSSNNGSKIPSKHQLKHYDETMQRAHVFKSQHSQPELKKTTKYRVLIKFEDIAVLLITSE